MKIIVDLPGWCDERHISIFAGIELAAYKPFGEDRFKIKTARCVQCGNCCVNLPKGQYPLDEQGDCVHLDKGAEPGEARPCKLGAMRPFPCCEGDPAKSGWADIAKCSIKYKTARKVK